VKLIPRRPRRVSMPAPMSAALGLDEPAPGERLLAWSVLVGGGAAAATTLRLRIATPRGDTLVRPWVSVDHAVWDQDSRTLVIWWVDSRRTTPLEIQDDIGRLPEVVRERVQSSVVLTASVPLPNGRAARVALRRGPGGELSAQALVPPGVKEDAPDVAPVLARAVDALWAEVGDQGLDQAGLPGL
jgi:hypothetical protein